MDEIELNQPELNQSGLLNNALGTKKYIIACPNCGALSEASKGFLGVFGATRRIKCGGCNQQFTIKEAKMTTRQCPHCGNGVILDQTQGEKAICPVCHNPINTRESLGSQTDITCPTCGCRHSVDKNSDVLICPLCDTAIDVQQEIRKESERKKGVASLIKYEGGNDVFVYRHPIEDFNLGSQLIVNESQVAIFYKDGKALDEFGAGRYTLSTQNLPLLGELYKMPFGDSSIFHSQVYFVNMATQTGLKWGTDSKVRLFDPGSGLHVEIGACGSINLRVSNPRKLIVKLVGTESILTQRDIIASGDSYGTTGMQGKFRSLVMSEVKANLAHTIKAENINILEIDENIKLLSEKMIPPINEALAEYGLEIPEHEFYITRILTPDDDPNFRRLKEQFASKTLKVREEEIKKAEAEAAQERKLVEAETERELKRVEAESKLISAQADAEAYKMKAMAEAAEMKAKGYTYQQETARRVGVEAMKNGLFGEGGGDSGIGNVAGLGVALGAMGGVMSLTKDALNPIVDNSSQIGAGFGGVVSGAADNTWNCSCGRMSISTKFCPECGEKKPEPVKGWDCPNCGIKGITSKFCPECGTKQPETAKTWDCPNCGFKGIVSKFCPECGTKRPNENTNKESKHNEE